MSHQILFFFLIYCISIYVCMCINTLLYLFHVFWVKYIKYIYKKKWEVVEDCIFGISFLDVYLSKIPFRSTNYLNDSYSCDLLRFPAGILLQIASLFQNEKSVSYFDKLRKLLPGA